MIGRPAIALPEESFDTRRSQVLRAGRSPGVRGLVVWWEWSKPADTVGRFSFNRLSVTHSHFSLLACAKRSRANGWAWVPVIKVPGYRCGRPPPPRDAKRSE